MNITDIAIPAPRHKRAIIIPIKTPSAFNLVWLIVTATKLKISTTLDII